MRKLIFALAAIISLSGVARAQTVSLDECLASAAASNRGLKAMTHEVRAAEEQIDIVRSGMLLPRIDLQGGYTAQQAAQAFQFGLRAQEVQDANFASANLSIYDTLYDFGRTRARVGAARMQAEAARNSYDAAEQDLFLQVVRAYYGILEAEKVVGAANDELQSMSAHQKTAQALFDEGVVTRNDLLQAEVRVANSRQKVLSAKNAVENAWLQLNYLTGAPPEFRGRLQEDAIIPVPAGGDQVPDLTRRTEIAALRNAVTAGEYAVKEAKTAYFPEIFAKLGLDYVQNSHVREQVIMGATVGLKVNLFDGGAKTHRVRQAVEARRRDEERLRDLEQQVRLELATAQNDLQVAAARIRVAEKAIAQGTENLRITSDRYAEKVGTATEVADAQTLLTQTRTDYYQSIYDYQVAAARVKRATGTL